jgi:hypothetical protein
MISQYHEIIGSVGIEGEVVEPEQHAELLDFLEQLVAEQYNVETWAHKSRSRKIVLKQKPRDDNESFEPYQGQIVVYYESKVNGTDIVYRQQDIIPEIRDAPKDLSNDEPEYYVIPDVHTIKVPFKSRNGLQWKYRKNSDLWWRADGLT